MRPVLDDFACSLAVSMPQPCIYRKNSGSTNVFFAWQVRELKQILDERKLSYAGLSQERELVDRIRDTCQSVTHFAAS